MSLDLFSMLDSTSDEDSVRPEAVGIVVEVNANLHSAVIHTEGYGRVLMPTQLAGDDFVLGDWCSVKVERNDEKYSSELGCSFIVCDRPKKVAEVYSTSVSISKDFLEGVIVCAPIFVGNIVATGAVAVNPQFGRIFIDPLRVMNSDLRPLMWIEAHLRYCSPNESSFFCRWMAHNLKPITEDQQTAKVYRYSGRFRSFTGEHVLVVDIEPCGLAHVRPEVVNAFVEESLVRGSRINVYGTKPVSSDLSIPIDVCYAVLSANDPNDRRGRSLSNVVDTENIHMSSVICGDSSTEQGISVERADKGHTKNSALEPKQGLEAELRTATFIDRSASVSDVEANSPSSEMTDLCSGKCTTMSILSHIMSQKETAELVRSRLPNVHSEIMEYLHSMQCDV